MDNTLKITCETEGFDEATEKIEALAGAYDNFPTNVMIKGCRDCTFNIYPSQTAFITASKDEADA